jgi:P27 family predicted phage terminase small subunit
MRGRPKKPTHLKVVSGTYRPHREQDDEPQLAPDYPPPPDHLNDGAKAAWHQAASIAYGMGVLTGADTAALEALAGALGDLRAARAALERPLTLSGEPGDDGQPTQSVLAEGGERYYWTFGKSGPMRRARPELADISDADRRIASWVGRFGMTPADRGRVSAAPAEEENAFAALG